MAAPGVIEYANAAAAIISAIGGCAAALAAFRSARSANDAAHAANDTSRRAALQAVSATAADVVTEAKRVQLRESELLLKFANAMVHSGSFQNSGILQEQRTVTDLAGKAEAFIQDAYLFTGGAKCLMHAPLDEIDRVAIRQLENLTIVRTTLIELDRKFAEITALNTEARAIARANNSGARRLNQPN